ncbi:hypothetical protein BJX64DRAFT_34333 [Aspergillus heterothallicus]
MSSHRIHAPKNFSATSRQSNSIPPGMRMFANRPGCPGQFLGPGFSELILSILLLAVITSVIIHSKTLIHPAVAYGIMVPPGITDRRCARFPRPRNHTSYPQGNTVPRRHLRRSAPGSARAGLQEIWITRGLQLLERDTLDLNSDFEAESATRRGLVTLRGRGACQRK